MLLLEKICYNRDMDSTTGGMSSNRQRQIAAEIARKKVLAVYSSAADKINQRVEQYNSTNTPYNTATQPAQPERDYYQTPVYQQAQATPWQQTQTVPVIQHNFNNTGYQNPYYTNQSSLNADSSEPQNFNHTTEPSQTYNYNPEAQSSMQANFASSATTETENYSTPENRRAERYDRKYGDQLDREIQELESMEDNEEETWNNDIIPDEALISNNLREDVMPTSTSTSMPSALKDTPVNADVTAAEWEQYHSAWQNYYQKYYNDYYSKAAQAYIATEKMKDERIATGKKHKAKRTRRLIPLFIIGIIVLVFLFLQYNRLIFAPIMAYIAPDSGDVTTSLEAVNPNINQPVSPEPRLIIPKLNIDVPVAFDIHFNDVMEAMNYGVAHYSIPGANALPGQIGNFVITGHSAGDIYSNNPYKFIFSGLERLQDGDLIYVNYNSVRYTYQMTRRETVEPSNVAALIYETDKPMLTLITCTPLGTSRYRLLITAEQISPAYETAPTEEGNETAIEEDIRENEEQDVSMPTNEPSFFEGIWNWLTGKS